MRFLVLCAAVLGCVGLKSPSSQPSPEVPGEGVRTGTFKNLGPQISTTLIQGSAFTKDPSGKTLVCCVVRGQPAKLVVFDVESGKRVHLFALNEADGAWNATTASDGSVYVGTDPNGRLFRWVPGEQSV